MFELKVVTSFAAAHQLSMVSKKCENLHGHNWKIEAFIGGETLNAAGVLLDFGELKRCLSEIVSGLDHTFLNESEKFAGVNPSSENIARYIGEALQAKIGGSSYRVTRVTAWESEDACASFIPPGGSA